MDWEFGIGRGKLFYIRRINKKAPVYNIGNCTRYPVTNHNGKRHEKEYIYICKYHCINLLYSSNEPNTVNQPYFNKKINQETDK